MQRNAMILVVLAASLSLCSATRSSASDATVNDQSGSSFMEEVTPPAGSSSGSVTASGIQSQPAPQKNVRLPQDLSNVGVSTDQNGQIIPLMHNGQPLVQPNAGGIQSYNEVPALTVPYNANGFPAGGVGTTFVPTGQMMAVPNPYYQRPNVNFRVGPMMFNNRPGYYPNGMYSPYGYGPYGPVVAPPATLMVPVAPNATTTYSTPYGSSSVTNRTQSFGPSTTNPLPMTGW